MRARFRGNVVRSGEYSRKEIEAQYLRGCGEKWVRGEWLYMDNGGFIEMQEPFANTYCGKRIPASGDSSINWVYFCPLCAAESGWVW